MIPVLLSKKGVKRKRHWLAKMECFCGKIYFDFNPKRSKSCGCLTKLLISASKKTHGGSGIREYHSWAAAKGRCYNKSNAAYDRYGGRGIKMCTNWENSFSAFLSDMGKRPSEYHSLDRIDNDRGYTPENCRWATASQQSANRKNIIFIEGIPLKAYCNQKGLKYKRVWLRIKRGMEIKKALFDGKFRGGFDHVPYYWSRKKGNRSSHAMETNTK